MPEMMALLWLIVQIVIGINLIMPLLVYTLALLRRSSSRSTILNPCFNFASEADFAVIVTAYQQTTHLDEVVASLVKMNYSNYLIYIVADNCEVSSLFYSSDKVVLLRPPNILQSNTKSHLYAIQHFRREHKYLTIIDSDNLVDPQYLHNMHVAFSEGYLAVQGLRAAKNLDSNFACLDAARDHYYHYYDGRLLFQAGSSATLAGSGMSFETSLYKQFLSSRDIQGAGFDKVLQYTIVSKGLRIAWSETAIVYDQKTSESGQLVKQRARWINTWLRYFGFGFRLVFKGLVNANGNQLLFGATLLRPPLFIFLLLSLIFAIADIWIQPAAVVLWVFGFGCFITAFLFALKNTHADRRIYRALINIPGFVFHQLVSLSKVRKANEYSVSTLHTSTPGRKGNHTAEKPYQNYTVRSQVKTREHKIVKDESNTSHR